MHLVLAYLQLFMFSVFQQLLSVAEMYHVLFVCLLLFFMFQLLQCLEKRGSEKTMLDEQMVGCEMTSIISGDSDLKTNKQKNSVVYFFGFSQGLYKLIF